MMRRIFPFVVILLLIGGCMWAASSDSDRRMALRQLVERANDGDPKSLFDLARLHDTGYDSILQDTLRSNALYLISAEKGYAPARNFIGFRYYNGDGFNRNIDSALYWIQKAADDGDITAASNLGYLLSQGSDIPHDYQAALAWLKKAAEAGLPTAIALLADMKRQGLGCNPDTLAAVSLYEQASDRGVGDAQLKLLAMMGFKWKSLPADSALVLGMKYYTGSAPVAGVDLLEHAADADNPKALALLGDAYSRGIGVEYDHDKSIDYFFKAAQAGDPSAQFIIAELLEFFPDAIDTEPAKYWYNLAEKAGITDSESAYNLLFSLPS